jgi:hypothetical protein
VGDVLSFAEFGLLPLQTAKHCRLATTITNYIANRTAYCKTNRMDRRRWHPPAPRSARSSQKPHAYGTQVCRQRPFVGIG